MPSERTRKRATGVRVEVVRSTETIDFDAWAVRMVDWLIEQEAAREAREKAA